ncbi:hypothetical protein, partial [Streptomyces decoyicus]|uniref:hypothetical protein n=1 Tax=Streptomyces decoyicus TaxID=249567 RepID=UPI0033BCF6F9
AGEEVESELVWRLVETGGQLLEPGEAGVGGRAAVRRGAGTLMPNPRFARPRVREARTLQR